MGDASPWLVANADLIPRGGTVLDVACGSGRNAKFLAARGWRVHAVDRDCDALVHLRDLETITTECVDLETGTVSFGAQQYEGIIIFNYLHRPLMPVLIDAVKAGGVLIYETFTVDQAARGRPRNPAFLLKRGELPTLVSGLRVLRAREGEFDGKCVASIVAMR